MMGSTRKWSRRRTGRASSRSGAVAAGSRGTRTPYHPQGWALPLAGTPAPCLAENVGIPAAQRDLPVPPRLPTIQSLMSHGEGAICLAERHTGAVFVGGRLCDTRAAGEKQTNTSPLQRPVWKPPGRPGSAPCRAVPWSQPAAGCGDSLPPKMLHSERNTTDVAAPSRSIVSKPKQRILVMLKQSAKEEHLVFIQ